ncbi:MAG: hypothetical protein WDM71_10975 [Ferruginibacter sp.]
MKTKILFVSMLILALSIGSTYAATTKVGEKTLTSQNEKFNQLRDGKKHHHHMKHHRHRHMMKH